MQFFERLLFVVEGNDDADVYPFMPLMIVLNLWLVFLPLALLCLWFGHRLRFPRCLSAGFCSGRFGFPSAIAIVMVSAMLMAPMLRLLRTGRFRCLVGHEVLLSGKHRTRNNAPNAMGGLTKLDSSARIASQSNQKERENQRTARHPSTLVVDSSRAESYFEGVGFLSCGESLHKTQHEG